MMHIVRALLLLAVFVAPAHAGYWKLVDTQREAKAPNSNDAPFTIEDSGTGFVATTINTWSYHQHKGVLVSQSSWSLPPEALRAGWRVELQANMDVQRNGLNENNAIHFFNLGVERGARNSGSRENIVSLAVQSNGSQRANGSGYLRVPEAAPGGKLWVIAEITNGQTAYRRVVYTYQAMQGEIPAGARTTPTAPQATGGGSTARPSSGTGITKPEISVTTDQPENTGSSSSGGGQSGEVEIFNNGNLSGVANNGKSPVFTLSRAARITSVLTYHYNNGRGAPGGNIQIMAEDGTIHGPWQVEVRNKVYWITRPNLALPPGRYRVIDTDPATWSQNSGSNGQGHTIIKGIWGGGGTM